MARSSERYWVDREREHMARQVQNNADIAEKLKENYQRAINEIQEQVDAFVGRYADNSGISISDARERINKHDVKAFQDKAKQYVQERNFSKRANRELKLYNVTMRTNRLELLKANMALELVALGSDNEQVLQAALTDGAREEYKRQAGILGETVTYNDQSLRAIVDSSFQSVKWSERLWKDQKNLRTELDKLLNRGISQGLNSRDLARDLRRNMDASVYNSERLLRTEMARVRGDVFKDSAEQNAFSWYEFICEANPCDDCEPLDGKFFKLKDMQPGKNASPMHPNCMCSWAVVHEDDVPDDMKAA